jgi:hypothetical protein
MCLSLLCWLAVLSTQTCTDQFWVCNLDRLQKSGTDLTQVNTQIDNEELLLKLLLLGFQDIPLKESWCSEFQSH